MHNHQRWGGQPMLPGKGGNRWFVPRHRPEAGAGLARCQLGDNGIDLTSRKSAADPSDFALGTAMKIDWN